MVRPEQHHTRPVSFTYQKIAKVKVVVIIRFSDSIPDRLCEGLVVVDGGGEGVKKIREEEEVVRKQGSGVRCRKKRRRVRSCSEKWKLNDKRENKKIRLNWKNRKRKPMRKKKSK